MSARDPEPRGPDEAATAALEEAAALAFGVLKVVMALLLALFLASGAFTVASHEAAFRRRLGVLDPEPLHPGLNWGWPVIDEDVRVDRRPEVHVVRTFDLARGAEDLGRERPVREGGLDPRRDGYLLTGDANLLHVTLAAQVAPQAPLHRALVAAVDPDALVEVLLERAATRVAASRPVQPLLGAGKEDFQHATRRALQDALDDPALDAGLAALGVEARDLAPAPQVRDAFDEVDRAAQEADRLRSQAQAAASRIESGAQVEAARIVARARGEGAALVADARADARRLEALRAQATTPAARSALERRLLAEALTRAFGGVGETFLVGDGELRLRLERDASSARAAATREALEGGQ